MRRSVCTYLTRQGLVCDGPTIERSQRVRCCTIGLAIAVAGHRNSVAPEDVELSQMVTTDRKKKEVVVWVAVDVCFEIRKVAVT
jgi:hypothetical protein